MLEEHGRSPWRKSVTAGVARVAAVAFVLYLCFRISQPFIIPLLWGACLTIVFWPFNAWLRRRLRWRWLLASLSTLVVCLLIITPALYLGAALVDEIVGLSVRLEASAARGDFDTILNLSQQPVIKQIIDRLKPWVNISDLDIKSLVETNVNRLAGHVLDRTSRLIANLPAFLLDLAVILLTLFFLFRDGDGLVALAKESVPMRPAQTEELFSHLCAVVRLALYGGVLVAAMQGFLGGVAFAVVGLPAPILWGAVMAFCSFIPVFGAALVYAPAGLLLILQGAIGKGVLLLGLGFGVISTIDNLLRPVVVGSRTRMHTLVLFVAILGGLRVFGLLGLIMGPVMAAVFITLVRFYLAELRLTRATTAPPP